MTIRTKLLLMTQLTLMSSMGLLSYGIVAVEKSHKKKNLESASRIIEDSAQRVAMEALLQKDELQLLSYVNFLKALYPALVYAKIDWREEKRTQAVTLGKVPDHGRIQESTLEVMDPANANRRVSIGLGIDQAVLEQETNKAQEELGKVVLVIWTFASLVGILIVYWLTLTVTVRLKRLSDLAVEIGSGKLGQKLEWSSDDELSELVSSFNIMSEKLSALDDAKKSFISSVTHELRSPLGAIENFLDMIEAKLKEESPNAFADALSYVSRIKPNLARLSRFINDLLDAAKIEKGKMTCVLKPCDFAEIAKDACALYEPKSKKLGVTIECRAERLPAVLADSDRLKQILGNLISNSLKFTPPGGRISISAETYRGDSGHWVEVSVQDTGRGIDPKDLPNLSTPFAQGKNSASSMEKGTGLGLYIVKSIIEQHGGQLEMKSTLGQGTTIVFTLQTA